MLLYTVPATNTNTWMFIVMTWCSNSNVQIYINGNLENSGTFAPATTNSANLCIGKPAWTDNYYYNGSIDNIRIYDIEIPTNLIQALYTENN